MRGFGFSIRGLLLAVTLAAVGIYALVNATPLWASAAVSVTTLALLTALLTVACRPSPQRAFFSSSGRRKTGGAFSVAEEELRRSSFSVRRHIPFPSCCRFVPGRGAGSHPDTFANQESQATERPRCRAASSRAHVGSGFRRRCGVFVRPWTSRRGCWRRLWRFLSVTAPNGLPRTPCRCSRDGEHA